MTTMDLTRRLKKAWTALARPVASAATAGTHRATLDRLLAARRDGHSLRQIFGAGSDDFWLWCFTNGYREDERLRSLLPSFPPDEIQYNFAGAAGDDTMRDAFSIYCLIRMLTTQHAPRAPETIMEFGSGWGRIIRYFLRDVEPDRLWGLDCMPEAIAICKDTNPYCRFQLVDPFPPTSVPSESFDLIYSYSVFSHLSEEAHSAWLGEFKRLLKPGGLLIATTRGREFILQCAKARAAGERRAWAQGTVLSFKDTNDALARFDRGEYLYEAIGGGGVLDASFFGETCIPMQYVLDHWTRLFEFVGYIDDRSVCQQNVVIVRKTA